MKKRLSIVLSILMLLGIFSGSIRPSHAAARLTDRQISEAIRAGYPSEVRGSIHSWYSLFEGIDYIGYGESSTFDLFLSFCRAMKYSSSPSNLSEYAVTARGIYSEISDHYDSNKFIGMKAVWDCLVNRYYRGGFGNSLYEVSRRALDAINPSGVAYWRTPNVINPIVDATHAGIGSREALIFAYLSSWDKYFHSLSGYGLVPDGYYYFGEKSVAGSIQVGQFYFRKNF